MCAGYLMCLMPHGRDFPSTSPTQQRLQKAVYQQAMSFLHLHMLPLKSLPKILKHASPHGSTRPNGALAAIKYNETANGSGSKASSSSAVSAMEAEEKELRERLIVLEEQRFLVGEMMDQAKRRRQFDEMAALSGNVDDLAREIDGVQSRLRAMDFEGAYLGEIGAP